MYSSLKAAKDKKGLKSNDKYLRTLHSPRDYSYNC